MTTKAIIISISLVVAVAIIPLFGRFGVVIDIVAVGVVVLRLLPEDVTGWKKNKNE